MHCSTISSRGGKHESQEGLSNKPLTSAEFGRLLRKNTITIHTACAYVLPIYPAQTSELSLSSVGANHRELLSKHQASGKSQIQRIADNRKCLSSSGVNPESPSCSLTVMWVCNTSVHGGYYIRIVIIYWQSKKFIS